MLENHSHPAIRNRQIPVKRSPPSTIPVPVEVVSIPSPMPEPEPTPVLPLPVPAPVEPKPMPRPIRSTSTDIDVGLYITCVIVNFKTKRLTKQALTSFLKFYPDVHVTLIDNGSHDGSTALVRQAGDVYPKVCPVLYDTNIGHGPAMHKAMLSAFTEYVFTLDSDCTVERGGFLEKMLRTAQADNLYAIGWKRWVDKRTGVPSTWIADGKPDKKYLIPYIHPCASLYRCSMYKELSPFVHHGAPCVNNMTDAEKKGFAVASFPIFQYVTHLKAGTRRMYGGRWNPKDGEKARTWTKDGDWPI